MEEYTKLINRLLDRIDDVEVDKNNARTAVIERSVELDKLKAENDELKNIINELRQQIKDLKKYE